ncbi:hypothetical protein HS088_TW21G01543 [Tripterygium wilfordii]|uniref:Uncharacterized protein n=1 Tax=Tripterygium wilfordii TaxID=458696 RepID=A0A7J7C5I6_TRIWF|nr:hypothetical protein HS088_TW21G01543 [Tripterygium wilfordii]
MKTILVLLVVFILVAETLQADEGVLTAAMVMHGRRLLSDPAAKDGHSYVNIEDDDNKNESYNNYGQDSGSSTETHHYYTDDTDKPAGKH